MSSERSYTIALVRIGFRHLTYSECHRMNKHMKVRIGAAFSAC